MEEWVGGLWDRFITKKARRDYPESVVHLAEVEKILGVMFRAFGGDAGLRVAAAAESRHGARQRFLERIAGTGEKCAQTTLDRETLRLPPSIAWFPEKSLNRDLYLWLAALAAGAGPDLFTPLSSSPSPASGRGELRESLHDFHVNGHGESPLRIMKHAPLTPIPSPTLPLKGRERCSSPLKGGERCSSPLTGRERCSSPFKGRERCSSPFKGGERCSSPFKGEAGRGMGNVFHVNPSPARG
ncbi:MAG: hypothetical protein Q8O19_06670, partial [Rectinemataceae bacterium]|nr:hypothetical protein [Rectinemataceae bacterium]